MALLVKFMIEMTNKQQQIMMKCIRKFVREEVRNEFSISKDWKLCIVSKYIFSYLVF